MHSTKVSLDCPPEVFFENHVDFDHFSEIHKRYSQPKLINLRWQKNTFVSEYSLLFGKTFKQKLKYTYTVTRICTNTWEGLIQTSSLGIKCLIAYIGNGAGNKTELTIIAYASAWWMTPAMREYAADKLLKNYLREFEADKSVIEGDSGRFPKQVLTEQDRALSAFRQFAERTTG